ncbi:MAG: 3-oxoacyl-[acyl-carrier-protein] reductase, partial [Lachnospiraceae bacterium]|nr:3-oxoacyl-[acyl-carrier-protein] reductase [Lachnospiraceae bacterium]
KVALVTGASRGIGREIAQTLAAYGASVIVNYNGSKDRADEVVEMISAGGGKAIAVKADVAKAEEIARLFEEAQAAFGRIDILVNNAGITRDNLILKMSEEEYDTVLDTNLKGAFLCMKHAAKIMLRQKNGRIINISSISGIAGNAGQANYCAAKAGLIGLTKSLAKELGSRGITVNAVAPGFIETEMTEKLSEQVKEGMLAQIPLKRAGSVKDIAEAVAFLASERAAYITGQTLSVNGGMAM